MDSLKKEVTALKEDREMLSTTIHMIRNELLNGEEELREETENMSDQQFFLEYHSVTVSYTFPSTYHIEKIVSFHQNLNNINVRSLFDTYRK